MMRRYPEYKESGVEWIGEIPKHWTLTRLKYVSNIPVTYGLNIEADRYTTEGIRLIRVTDIDESGGLRQKGVYLSEDCVPQEQVLNSYDLLLSRSGTVGKSYLHLKGDKHTSAGYLVRFNFGDYCTSKFIYYVTLSHFYRNWLEQQVIISTIQNVNGEKYSNFQLPIPLHREKIQIVNFLDRKTGQIDELIRIKERLVELLQEQRTVVINQVVTQGLDPNVEMKPSGVEWIGKIPKHWEITKIRHIATFVSQKSTPEIDAIKISPENVESETGKVLDLYSSYDSTGVKFQAGDLLFNKLRVYLSKVVFTEYNGYSLGEMIVIRPSLQDSGKHLFYLMLSCRFIEYCNSISKGVKMPRTDVDDILNAQIPLASFSEQIQIANFLDRKTGQIDKLIAAEQRKIELLKEYRQSLISEVVTGKIDVRNEV